MNGKVCMDNVVKFENLADDLSKVSQLLGLPDLSADLPHAKASPAGQRSQYKQLYGPKERAIVKNLCAEEFTAFESAE